jgi:hypothetical protein
LIEPFFNEWTILSYKNDTMARTIIKTSFYPMGNKKKKSFLKTNIIFNWLNHFSMKGLSCFTRMIPWPAIIKTSFIQHKWQRKKFLKYQHHGQLIKTFFYVWTILSYKNYTMARTIIKTYFYPTEMMTKVVF